eukprot:scaffold8336_cov96-Skeletonema_dohrnii-CCMP3373.AAC.7
MALLRIRKIGFGRLAAPAWLLRGTHLSLLPRMYIVVVLHPSSFFIVAVLLPLVSLCWPTV